MQPPRVMYGSMTNLPELRRLGDLVTIPSPYLDTACPEGWSQALRHVTDTPFKIAIPGHGPLLSRTQVMQYRTAFDAFIDWCAKSSNPKTACATTWSNAMRALLGDKPLDTASAADGAAGLRGHVACQRRQQPLLPAAALRLIRGGLPDPHPLFWRDIHRIIQTRGLRGKLTPSISGPNQPTIQHSPAATNGTRIAVVELAGAVDAAIAEGGHPHVALSAVHHYLN